MEDNTSNQEVVAQVYDRFTSYYEEKTKGEHVPETDEEHCNGWQISQQ